VHLVKTAANDVVTAATATADFVKNHAAAIAGIVVSVGVFFGCEAALGIPSLGVGAVAGAPACGALAGAAGNAVSYGITAAQTGKFSWTGLAETTLTGAAIGGLSMGLGGAEGALGDAATDLLIDGAASDSAEAATSAAAQGAVNDGAAATADTADNAATTDAAQNAPPGGTAAEDGGSGIGEDLYHFGRSPNSDLEPIRGARPSDFGVTNGTDTVGPYAPTGPLDEVGGASTYIDAESSGLNGHYYGIPAGTELPEGLGIQADGEDVGGTAPSGHRTIYPTVPMTFDQFQELFRSLPWSYMGNLK
jgi:hypothetical protein